MNNTCVVSEVPEFPLGPGNLLPFLEPVIASHIGQKMAIYCQIYWQIIVFYCHYDQGWP